MIPRESMQRLVWLVIVLAVIGVFVWGLSNLARPPEPPRPLNLVVIIIDTVRADFMGAYGHPGS